jgi:hypothetical protein
MGACQGIYYSYLYYLNHCYFDYYFDHWKICRHIVHTFVSRWWVQVASTTGLMPLNTGKSSRVSRLVEKLPHPCCAAGQGCKVFLFEFHSFRFLGLDLPPLPADRSDFDVHGAIMNDEV